MPEVRIGTSGWNYAHWREIFYPKGLKQIDWLRHFAGSFDTVEINATFYRLPRPEYVTRWHDQAPPGFLFAVKGSRYLTHVKRLAMTGDPVDRFFDVLGRLGDRFGPVLWQLPPSMQRDDDRLGAFAGYLPGDRRHAFEFRHESWFCQEVYDILDNAGAALCIADHAERSQPVVTTTGWTYLRFHYGRDGDGLYGDDELRGWAGRIRGFIAEGLDVYAYFNNDWGGYALRNAARLKELLG